MTEERKEIFTENYNFEFQSVLRPDNPKYVLLNASETFLRGFFFSGAPPGGGESFLKVVARNA